MTDIKTAETGTFFYNPQEVMTYFRENFPEIIFKDFSSLIIEAKKHGFIIVSRLFGCRVFYDEDVAEDVWTRLSDKQDQQENKIPAKEFTRLWIYWGITTFIVITIYGFLKFPQSLLSFVLFGMAFLLVYLTIAYFISKKSKHTGGGHES